MTIKLIDLLVKIANGEIKDKTKFRIDFKNGLYRDFYYDKEETEELNCLKNISDDYSLYDEISLNDEVEIIEDVEIIEEDKKIEKLERVNGSDLVDLQSNSSLVEQNKAVTNLIMYLNMNVVKINEIIDRLNEMDKGE